MKRFGVTTIARWLGEELPEGVRAYIQHRGTLLELLRLVKMDSPRLLVNVRPLNIPEGDVTRPLRMRVGKGTPVVLSVSEDLMGVNVDELEGDLAPAASNSWAMNTMLDRCLVKRPKRSAVTDRGAGMYCG